MSGDPIKDIRKEEEDKKKALAKREDEKNKKLKKIRNEESKKLGEKKDELINELKTELAGVQERESETLKSNLAKETSKIEKYVSKIKSDGKIEKAVDLVLDTFLSKR